MKKLLFILILFPAMAHAQNRLFDLSSMQAALPTIVVGNAFASPFTNAFGSNTGDQTISFTSNHCTDSVRWRADAGMQVSKDGTNWDTAISYPANSFGTVHNRGTGTRPVGSYSGNLIGLTSGGNSVYVAYTATVTAPASLSVSPSSITLTDTLGANGYPQNVVVTFSGTTVSVGALTNVEYSKDGGSTYSTTQSLSSGSPVTLKARIPLTAPSGSITGNIAFSGTGVTTQNVAVSGSVTTVVAKDTFLVQMFDSLSHSGATGKYTSTTPYWNNWAPTGGVSASLTSAGLKKWNGTQTTVKVAVNGINDYAGNGSTYGNTNTMGFPAGVFVVSGYQTAGMTFTFSNLSAGSYKLEMVSSTAAGSGPYVQSFASGSATQSGVNAFNNLNTLVVLDNLTPTSGVITVTITPSNSFTVANAFRLTQK